MSDRFNSGFHLETEEVVATLAVLALAGFFIWHQLGRGGSTSRAAESVPRIASTLSVSGLVSTPLQGRGSTAAVSGKATSTPSAEPSQVLSQGQAAGCAPGKQPYYRNIKAVGPGECAVERPLISKAQYEELPATTVDEVILGGNMQDGGAVAAALPSSSIPSAIITSVNFNQAEGIISLSGKAPTDYEKVQVIVNGQRLDPVSLDATSNWSQQISAGNEELYLQLVGVDSVGELIVSEETMPSVYVVSLQDDIEQKSGVAVMAGQLYQVNRGETVASLAGDFGVAQNMLDKVNGLSGRSLVAGEVLFIPFTLSP